MDIEVYQQKYGNKWLKHWKRDKRAMKEPIYVKNSQHRLKAHWRDYDYYISNVKELTNDNKHLIPGIHKRGFHSYHIDHKISIKYGYENGILAEEIAHPSNCEMVWWKDNIRKGAGCKIDDNNQWIIDTLNE